MFVWKRPRIAKTPIQISHYPTARKVRLLDDRMDVSMFWVTPDAGSLGDFLWDHAIRRELKDRPGYLGKALDPFVREGKERADGEYRLDLVLDLKKNIRFKLARLLCDWGNDEGEIMDAMEQEGLEVDHISEGKRRQPPRNYCLKNLRPIDVPSHRKLQPARGQLRRPAASTTKRRRARA